MGSLRVGRAALPAICPVCTGFQPVPAISTIWLEFSSSDSLATGCQPVFSLVGESTGSHPPVAWNSGTGVLPVRDARVSFGSRYHKNESGADGRTAQEACAMGRHPMARVA